MWILESSSELFQGRRMWLKPGKSYLFGRVKNDGVRFAIEHKTISRKHFIIKVDDVDLGDVGNIHARSKVTLEDQRSKAGTTVNGEHIRGAATELKKEENYIKPGSLPANLVLKWHPCVLTYNLLKKELKAGHLKTKQERVKDLDIKAVSEYVGGQTTHLVVSKRNTPKSLQALIDGRPLVAESYIDALEYAATPTDLNEEENLSPLEQDFDAAWPDPFDYLPPPGREPTSRPAESYRPREQRKTIFENFTFVFVDQTQYENLLPPIATGHGKTRFFQIVTNETTTEELVSFLRLTAGQKTFGGGGIEGEKGGTILVRYKGDPGAEDWTNLLINEASIQLDQRAIDQGEFLDAILANNAMLLRQSVPYENGAGQESAQAYESAHSAPATQSSQLADRTAAAEINNHIVGAIPSASQASKRTQPSSNGRPEPESNTIATFQSNQHMRQQSPTCDSQEPPAKRARFLIMPKKSRSQGFDDDFDPSKLVPWHDDEETSVSREPATPSQAESDQDMVKPEPPSSRKRPRLADIEDPVNSADDMNDLLPAAALMKRRKLARAHQEEVQAESTIKNPLAALFRKPKREKEIDVIQEVKAQREAEAKAKKEYHEGDDEDEIQLQPGEKMPVYEVETVLIDLPARRKSGRDAFHAESDRWDPKWNGRKNFKGFRRAKDLSNGTNEPDTVRRITTKVIVPLVDAKTSTFGMGDQYWDKTAEEKQREREKKRRASQRATQSQSDHSRASWQPRSLTVNDSDEEDVDETNEQRASAELSGLQDETAKIVNYGVGLAEPQATRTSDTQIRTQTTASSTASIRYTTNGASCGRGAKKQTVLPITVVHDSDSDDSDDMKFRFGGGRRRGRGRA